MPSFSRNLEQALHKALALANERHHEYATLEHLLLALIDDLTTLEMVEDEEFSPAPDKIDLADECYVVDPDGYIGDCTRAEIEYAIKAKKPIYYLSRGD